MTFRTRTEELEYKGRTAKTRTKGWWCGACDEGILDGEALKIRERVLMGLKIEVDGLLRPDQITAIRKRLRLSQRRAGELIGGGPRAFQKYESGQVMVSAAMSKLLQLLDNDKNRLKELEEIEQLSSTG
jgi:HTH-type transcriptional regulator/antitoxin MqsA